MTIFFFGTSNPSRFAAKEAIVFCIYSRSIYYYFFPSYYLNSMSPLLSL